MADDGVGIEKQEILTRRVAGADVARLAEPDIGLELYPFYLGKFRAYRRGRTVFRSIIDHDHLEAHVGVLVERLQTVAQQVPDMIGDDTHRDVYWL